MIARRHPVGWVRRAGTLCAVFVLITTVRSVAGDREAGVYEYLLSLPIGLAPWYWGKLARRFLPVFLAMVGAIVWGSVEGASVPWMLFIWYTALLVALARCFLGIGMLLSTLSRSADVAQASAFVVWLTLLLFLDLILLGTLIRNQIPPETVVGIALANPMQVFRTAAMLLLDSQLVMLGPSAYVILDNFGQAGYMAYAILYPMLVGSACSSGGYLLFRRGDLP